MSEHVMESKGTNRFRKQGNHFMDEKDVAWNTVMQNDVQQKIPEPHSAGSRESHQGNAIPCLSCFFWASHSDHWQGQVIRTMDLTQDVPSSILNTSWSEFDEFHSTEILSQVF